MAGPVPVQTQEDLVPPAPAAIGYRWAGVLLAPSAAAAVHLAVAGPFGIDLQVPESPGSSALRDLGVLDTVVVSLVVALVGWLAVALLERGMGGARGRRIWTVLAFGVFVVSLVPIVAVDIPLGAQWGLFALHVTVALVLIPTLANGTPAAHPVAGGWVEAQAATAQEDTHADPVHATGHDAAHEVTPSGH